MRDVADARIISVTEAELAAARRAEGARIVERAGAHWEQLAPGFHQPVNLLRDLRLDQARAAPWGWGHRCVLRPEDRAAANGTLPLVRLPCLASYGIEALRPRRRSYLRQAQKLVRVVQLTDFALLEQQGHALVVDSLARTRHLRPPTREGYLNGLRSLERQGHWCVLAALIEGRLAGYLEAYAVDGVVFSPNIYFASWALPTNAASVLHYEFLLLCQRSEGLRIVTNGLDTPENDSLRQFKRSMGYVVEQVPIHWWMMPMMGRAIRRLRPHKFYRLTGHAALSPVDIR
jgi:hypothetical protein